MKVSLSLGPLFSLSAWLGSVANAALQHLCRKIAQNATGVHRARTVIVHCFG